MSIIGDIASVANVGVDLLNYGNQQKNLEYQKDIQQEAWAREDNAVQRRSRDLEMAGLSKTLAAGSSAQSSTPIHTDAPELKTNALALMKMKADISQTQAQTDLIKAQTENAGKTGMGLDIKNTIGSSTLGEIVAQAQAKTTAMGQENYGKYLDNQVRELKIPQNELQVISMGLKNQGIKSDNAAKEIAIQLANTNLTERERIIKIYEMLGLPSDTNLTDPMKYGLTGVKGWDYIKGLFNQRASKTETPPTFDPNVKGSGSPTQPTTKPSDPSTHGLRG